MDLLLDGGGKESFSPAGVSTFASRLIRPLVVCFTDSVFSLVKLFDELTCEKHSIRHVIAQEVYRQYDFKVPLKELE